MKKLLFSFIIFLSMIVTVEAGSCPKMKDFYMFENSARHYSSNSSDAETSRYTFRYTNKDLAGFGFCISPKKTAYMSWNICSSSFALNRNSDYNLAMNYAYQQLIKDDGLFTRGGNEMKILKPLLTFRWLASIYNKLETGGSGKEANLTYSIWDSSNPLKYFGSSTKIQNAAKAAQKIVTDAVALVNKIRNGTAKVNNLINQGTLWAPLFNVEIAKDNNGNQQVTFNANKKRVDVKVNVSVNDIKKVYWNKATVKCENGFTCKLVKNNGVPVTKNCGNNCKQYTVRVSTKKKSPCNYGIKFNFKYYDARDPGSFLLEVIAKTGNITPYQKFVLVRVPSSGDFKNSTDGSDDDMANKTVSAPNPTCNTTTTTPTTSTPPPPPPDDHDDPICEIQFNPVTGARVYYGLSGTITDANTYRRECVHICQTPNQNTEGKYYCNSDDPDYSGPECTYDEWRNKCTYCEINKGKCNANPNDPTCNDYWLSCPTCTASVSIPNYCTDFDTTQEIKGTISDINGVKGSCNYSEKPVKGCVLGGSDMAGNTYQLTESLKGNRYCQAYCYEEYTFNMPTAQHSTSGGYFNLNMSVEGKRHCYLSSPNMTNRDSLEPISKAQFDNQTFLNDINYRINQINSNRSNLEATLNTLNNSLNNLESTLTDEKKDRTEENDTAYKDATQKLKEDCDGEKGKIDRNTNLTARKKKNRKAKIDAECASKQAELDADYEATKEDIERDYNERLSTEQAYLNEQIDANTRNILETNVRLTNEIDQLINEFSQCATIANSWGNTMNFNPTIEYKYNDYSTYPNQYNTGTFSNTGVKTTTTDTYCYSETDGHYNCVDNNKVVINCTDDGSGLKCDNSAVRTTNISYNGLYQNADSTYSYRNKTVAINFPAGVEKTVTKTATFVPNQNFSTFHQYGTVVKGEPCLGTGFENCLWTRLPDTALPVELKTGKGAFPFQITVSDIGQYNDANKTLGRLVNKSQKDSVLSRYSSSQNKCSVSDDGSKTNFSTFTQDVGYVCAYINNCDECNVGCREGGCEFKCDGECNVKCRTCIFDGNNVNYKYRTFSLNDIFPNICSVSETNCRKEGYNWYADPKSITPLTAKAAATRDDIEQDGDTIYENPQYSFIVTPAQMSAIRAYNQKVGTYSNSTYITDNGDSEVALHCTQTNINGLQYSIKCLSSFLNESTGKYFKTLKRDTEFVLWNESSYCLSSGNCIISREDGIGPSWK